MCRRLMLNALVMLAISVHGWSQPEFKEKPPSLPYCVVDTGQRSIFSDRGQLVKAPKPGEPFFGQDAQYQSHQPSYTIGRDGLTVHDNNTGLTWQRSPDTDGDGTLCLRGNPGYGKNDFHDNGDGAITDRATGLMWSKTDSGKGMNWQNALAWVQKQNAEKFLGHADWRLPSVKELQSVVDYTRSPDTTNAPAISPLFGCTTITNEGGTADFPFYWSATTHVGFLGGGAAMYVAFGRAAGWPPARVLEGGAPGRRSGSGRGAPGQGGAPGAGPLDNGAGDYRFVDVHGAGCQRSDPKIGPPYAYATTHVVTKNGVTYIGYAFGPQGDAIRGLNFVRLVRDNLPFIASAADWMGY